jgi:enoyl-CoA hydratase
MLHLENLEQHVSLLKINRPESLNVLNKQTLLELQAFFHQRRQGAPFRVLILTGAGDKSFIAGADIKEMRKMSHMEMLQFCELGQEVFQEFASAPFVVIAAVNGYALGGGLELALAADFIYAAEHAKLGLPEVSLGITPGFGGTQRFARTIGKAMAKELALSGRMISAAEAHSIGLINKVCTPETLLDECLKTARDIARHSPEAVLQTKRAIDVGTSMGLEESLVLERNMCAVAFATEGRIRGMDAFIEKRGK